jgi:hypothetical protein
MRYIDGIEVLDAATDDEFEVTQEDADLGIPNDHHKCSIALGWRRFDPVAKDVIVGKSRAFKLSDRFGYLKWFRYQVSRPIQVQQAVLDNGGKLVPGVYTLLSLNKGQRTGKQQGSDKTEEQKVKAKEEKAKQTLVKTRRTPHHIPMRHNIPTQST